MNATATATMTVRVTPEQRSTIASVAEAWGMSVSEYVRNVVLDHIEDEYDIKVAQEAHDEYESDPTSISHRELMASLGLS